MKTSSLTKKTYSLSSSVEKIDEQNENMKTSFRTENSISINDSTSDSDTQKIASTENTIFNLMFIERVSKAIESSVQLRRRGRSLKKNIADLNAVFIASLKRKPGRSRKNAALTASKLKN
jgi:hypothetical protein